MNQILKIDAKTEDDEEELPLPPYKALEHFYRHLQTSKKNWAPLSSCWAVDVGTMFPRSHAQEKSVAEEICTTCPVTRQCLKLALVNQEDYGIWGGYSSKEIQNTIRHIKESYGNIWISWDMESEFIIDSIVAQMHERFIKENGIDEDVLAEIFAERLDKIDLRLSELKL